MRRRVSRTLSLALLLGAIGPLCSTAIAGTPVIIPAAAGPAVDNAEIYFAVPPYVYSPNQVAINVGGTVRWLGDIVTAPLIIDDSGGVAPAQYGVPWVFNVAGPYNFHCSCSTFMTGTVYVVGPRGVITPTMVSNDNSGPVTYSLDASGSFVTDFKAHSITNYAFDYTGDGTFDVSGPDAVRQVTFPGPGEYHPTVRVTDDMGRVADRSALVVIPQVTSAPPAVTGTPDDSADSTNSSGTLTPSTRKFSVKAARTLKVSALLRKGLVVRVRGLNASDNVRVSLAAGKQRLGSGSKSGDGVSTSLTVRLRLSRAGKRLVRSSKRPKSVKLAVTVSGADGFSGTKRVNARLRG